MCSDGQHYSGQTRSGQLCMRLLTNEDRIADACARQKSGRSLDAAAKI
jgi:hypothetical protein